MTKAIRTPLLTRVQSSPSPDSRSLTFTSRELARAPDGNEWNSYEDPDRVGHTATVRHLVSGAEYGDNDVTADSVRVSIDDDAWGNYFIDGPSVVDEYIGSITMTVTSIFYSKFQPRERKQTLFSS